MTMSLSGLDKDGLKRLLQEDKQCIFGDASVGHMFIIMATNHASWMRWKYVKSLRMENYYRRKYKIGKRIFALPLFLWLRRKNGLGNILGYEIGGMPGKGFTPYHNGPIVINKEAVIGEHCTLHGDNCIGTDGITNNSPIIGNYVSIGVGAKVLGGIHIADHVRIAAGAIVIDDILEEGCTVAGVPARIIKHSQNS